jgi:hypothetical protein
MVVTPYSLYMFNRAGECLQYLEWSRPRQPANAEDDAKMMFGLLFSLNAFAAKVDPTQGPQATGAGAATGARRTGFHSFRTSTYKLHYLELPSGLQLVLTTEPGCGDLRDCLRHLHSLYVELVAKSPLHAPGRPFVSKPFEAAVRAVLAAPS